MESTKSLSKRLVKTCKDPSIKGKEGELVQLVENQISWHINDALKIIRNINNTSLNKMDRAAKFIELEQKYGIPKTHLILDND